MVIYELSFTFLVLKWSPKAFRHAFTWLNWFLFIAGCWVFHLVILSNTLALVWIYEVDVIILHFKFNIAIALLRLSPIAFGFLETTTCIKMLITIWLKLVQSRVEGLLIWNTFAIKFTRFHVLEINWKFMHAHLFGVGSPKTLVVIHATNYRTSRLTVFRVIIRECYTATHCRCRWLLALWWSISFLLTLERKNLDNKSTNSLLSTIKSKSDKFFNLVLFWLLISYINFEGLHLYFCIYRILKSDIALLTVINNILAVNSWLKTFIQAIIKIEISCIKFFFSFNARQFCKTRSKIEGFNSRDLVIEVLTGALYPVCSLVEGTV